MSQKRSSSTASLRYANPVGSSSPYTMLIARPKQTLAKPGKSKVFQTMEIDERVARTRSRDSLKSNNSSQTNTLLS